MPHLRSRIIEHIVERFNASASGNTSSKKVTEQEELADAIGAVIR